MKEKKTTHKEIQRKTTLDKTVRRKEDLPGDATRIEQQCTNQVKSAKPNQRNGTNHTWYRSNRTQLRKEAPPDQAPIKPNKGSALPSKGKTKERPGAHLNRSTNQGARRKE